MVGFKGYLDIVMTREAKTNDSTDPELEMSTDRWECHSRQRYYYIIDSMSRTNTHNVPPTVGVVKTNSFIGVRNEEIFCLSGWAPWQWQTGESVGRSELQSQQSRERSALASTSHLAGDIMQYNLYTQDQFNPRQVQKIGQNPPILTQYIRVLPTSCLSSLNLRSDNENFIKLFPWTLEGGSDNVKNNFLSDRPDWCRYLPFPRSLHNSGAQGKNISTKRITKIKKIWQVNPISWWSVQFSLKISFSSCFRESCQSLWPTPNLRYKPSSTAQTSWKTTNWCCRRSSPNTSR